MIPSLFPICNISELYMLDSVWAPEAQADHMVTSYLKFLVKLSVFQSLGHCKYKFDEF